MAKNKSGPKAGFARLTREHGLASVVRVLRRMRLERGRIVDSARTRVRACVVHR